MGVGRRLLRRWRDTPRRVALLPKVAPMAVAPARVVRLKLARGERLGLTIDGLVLIDVNELTLGSLGATNGDVELAIYSGPRP